MEDFQLLFKILLALTFFSCGLKKPPIAKRKIPSVFDEYYVPVKKKEEKKK